MHTCNTALISITSLYERPVYRSYGLHGSKDDDDDDEIVTFSLADGLFNKKDTVVHVLH